MGGASLEEALTGASFVPLESGKAPLIAGNDQLGTRFLADSALYEIPAMPKRRSVVYIRPPFVRDCLHIAWTELRLLTAAVVK
jgi:hypothetical protein